jgi:hypothetical protein
MCLLDDKALNNKTVTDRINPFTHSQQHWPFASPQHLSRSKALLDMIIESGYPVTMIDQPAFRSLLSVLDPKFKLCGW